ncbi:MAG TPA: nickel pincer cofactor biosynthesis protein LarC [Methanocorpusculum sp.]|nr:nickel pincer cofactor biosynthesis protein LarC [Methanocorpusculum sp.]
MKILVFDPCFGAAGDMISGALLSLGADKSAVLSAVAAVSTPEISEVYRGEVPAAYVRTKTSKEPRSLDEIVEIIDASSAPAEAKSLAKRVFERIERAESRVHKTHHVHFHEVGADDAIADILGSCTALLSLNIDGVYVKPLALGSGTLTCAHGILPVPAPATAEIVKEAGLTVKLSSYEGELCTPTGAALLSEFAASFPAIEPAGRLLGLGTGAGTRNPKDHPNILRALLFEETASENTVDVLETNVDDVSGEILGSTLERLMAEGARDASFIPIQMKKGRPGFLIRVIAMPKDSARLARILAIETGSLGIRCIPMIHRFTAEREFADETLAINGRIYPVRIKYAFADGKIYSRKAEFDDCRKIALETGIPVKDIKRMAEEEAWKNQ